MLFALRASHTVRITDAAEKAETVTADAGVRASAAERRTAAPANTVDRPERPKEVDGTKLYGKLTGNDTAAADKQ